MGKSGLSAESVAPTKHPEQLSCRAGSPAPAAPADPRPEDAGYPRPSPLAGRCASQAASAAQARPRWLIAFFAASSSSA